MNINAITSIDLDRRMIAPLLCALVITAAIGLILAEQQNVDAARAERDVKLDLYERLTPTASPRSGSLPDRRGPITPFVVADTATTAAAEADRLIRSVVTRTGGEVLSIYATVVQDRGASTRVELQATIEGRIQTIQRVLYDIESGSPVVFVEDLSLRPSDRGSTKKDAQDPQLQATVTLSTYWRAGT